ncbi:MAG: DMT family transporter [Mesorhizobium sp.]|nr:DMT family transporter [Mesorhizobium sp.]MBN9245339.1 DMT family transporter [Mesorhizobium sp.]
MSSTDAAARSREGRTPGAAEYALLAGISIAWGTSYMFTKIAVASVPPLTLVAARTVIAAAAMLALMALRRRCMRLSGRELAAFALVGLLANAAPLSLIAVSVAHVHSSVTATTLALVPLITALFAIFRGQYPTMRSIAGILVGLAGIAVLFGPDAFASFGDDARGLVAAIAAALVFSASLFAMALVRRHDAVTVTTLSLVSAALWTTPVALLADGAPPALPDIGVLGAVLVLALFNTAAASLLMFALVPRAGPAFTAYNNYLVPAVAVVCGTVFLGEPLTTRSVAGVVLVLAGVAISTLRLRAPAPAAAST